MIIYHGRPCREHPIICKELVDKYTKIGIYQFHENFELINSNEYIKELGVLNYHPKQKPPKTVFFGAPHSCFVKDGILNPNMNGLSPYGLSINSYQVKIIYGVFPSNRLDKNNNFIFTLLDNPIDYVYNCFYYFNFVSKSVSRNVLKTLCGNYFNISIEEFIDNFISNGIPNFLYKNSNYKIIEDIFYCRNLNIYDLIIFRECPKIGFDKLNKITNLKLFCPQINSSIVRHNTYRRADIEELLKNDIFKYNEMKEKFLK